MKSFIAHRTILIVASLLIASVALAQTQPSPQAPQGGFNWTWLLLLLFILICPLSMWWMMRRHRGHGSQGEPPQRPDDDRGPRPPAV